MYKKISSLILIAVLVLLVGCNNTNKFGFKLNIDEINELRESVILSYTLDDSEDLLKDCDVKAKISKTSKDDPITTKTLSFDDENTGKVTFSSLDANTSYFIKIYVGYKGKNQTLVEKTVKTINEGSEDNPYLIKTVDDFTKVLKNDRKGYFKLDNDIDFEGKGINPLFSSSSAFNGVFDGNGKTIKNFGLGSETENHSMSTSYFGIFGYIGDNGVVKNLTIENLNLYISRNSSTNYVSTLCGYNSGTIEDVTIKDSKISYTTTSSNQCFYGGLVAKNDNGSINNCKVDLDFSVNTIGSVTFGGIAANNLSEGSSNEGTINNCEYNGTIAILSTKEAESLSTIDYCVGGLVGINNATIKKSTFTGKITTEVKHTSLASTSTLYFGGIVGKNNNIAAKALDCTTNVTYDLKLYNNLQLYVGFICAINGNLDYESTKASLKGCKYQSTEENSSISILNTMKASAEKEALYLFGLTAVDKQEYDGEKPYSTENEISVNVKFLEKDANSEFVENSTETIKIN